MRAKTVRCPRNMLSLNENRFIVRLLPLLAVYNGPQSPERLIHYHVQAVSGSKFSADVHLLTLETFLDFLGELHAHTGYGVKNVSILKCHAKPYRRSDLTDRPPSKHETRSQEHEEHGDFAKVFTPLNLEFWTWTHPGPEIIVDRRRACPPQPRPVHLIRKWTIPNSGSKLLTSEKLCVFLSSLT